MRESENPGGGERRTEGARPGGAWERVFEILAGRGDLLEGLARLRERCPGADAGPLLEAADASDHSLADWAEALTAFDRWLGERGAEVRPFAEMIGYIHCCTQVNRPGLPSPYLQALVLQSLEEFGFASVDSSQK